MAELLKKLDSGLQGPTSLPNMSYIKIQSALKLPGDLVKTDGWAPPPEFLFQYVWVTLENLHSNKFPGNADPLGLGPNALGNTDPGCVVGTKFLL